MLGSLVEDLRAEARRSNERRLLVLHGPPEATRKAAVSAFEDHDAQGVLVGSTEIDGLELERVEPSRSGELLGSTQEVVVLDAHEAFDPNVLGRVAGTVDGGGLLVLLTPPLDAWPDRRDGFDAHLAVPPFELDAVTGRFRQRLIETLRSLPGIAVVDAGTGEVERPGTTDPDPHKPPEPPSPPSGARFPEPAYAACRTPDQLRAVRALEALAERGSVVVPEADRGRGKSSAAGLAAGALAAEGRRVLVTAPGFRSVEPLFDRARELLTELGAGPAERKGPVLGTPEGGQIRFHRPARALDELEEADAVVVDEAAALPVHVLAGFLAGDRPVAFATTVHGYEGAGRGFSVRFKDRLEASDRAVHELTLADPIRYAAGDPVEAWLFHALLLDARPPVDELVQDARPDTVTYEALTPEDLLEDEHLLREAFGLLVLAHYRTTPSDLARLLDAPNIEVRALLHEGHVVSVALLAREGGLPADVRARMYDGEPVRGNLIPDVLTSQLRDEEAGVPVGWRVMRIATHDAARRRGLGSLLLERIRAETEADWVGVSYGATSELLRFWRRNGYRTVHLSTSRNETSGEHSAIMLDPLSEAGRELHDRTSRWFIQRIPGVLADALDGLEADVVREALGATDASPELAIGPRAWRLVASAAFGPGIYDVSPRPFRQLALAHLVEGEAELGQRAERLLVRKVLQARPWDEVADELGFHSRREAMIALGDAYEPLVGRYGNDDAQSEGDRYR